MCTSTNIDNNTLKSAVLCRNSKRYRTGSGPTKEEAVRIADFCRSLKTFPWYLLVSALSICDKYLRQVSATSICNKHLQQASATSICNKYLQQVSATSICNKHLQQASATSICNKHLQQVFTASIYKYLQKSIYIYKYLPRQVPATKEEAGFYRSPTMPPDIYKYLWTSASIYKYLQAPTSTYKYLQVSTRMYKYLQISAIAARYRPRRKRRLGSWRLSRMIRQAMTWYAAPPSITY